MFGHGLGKVPWRLKRAGMSVLLSSSYIVIGTAKVAKVGQYVPTPVLNGYQASIGWLLLASSIFLIFSRLLSDE